MHENFDQSKRMDDLFKENSDLRLRLMEAESREVAIPQARVAREWFPEPRCQNWDTMTAEQKKNHLLISRLHN